MEQENWQLLLEILKSQLSVEEAVLDTCHAHNRYGDEHIQCTIMVTIAKIDNLKEQIQKINITKLKTVKTKK